MIACLLLSSGHAWKCAEVSNSWLHWSRPCKQQPQHAPQVYYLYCYLSGLFECVYFCRWKRFAQGLRFPLCYLQAHACKIANVSAHISVMQIYMVSSIPPFNIHRSSPPPVSLVVPSLLLRSCPKVTISSFSLNQVLSTWKEAPMTECWGGSSKKRIQTSSFGGKK